MTLLQLDVPFEATSLTNVTVTAPPQLSVAVTDVDARRAAPARSTGR